MMTPMTNQPVYVVGLLVVVAGCGAGVDQSRPRVPPAAARLDALPATVRPQTLSLQPLHLASPLSPSPRYV